MPCRAARRRRSRGTVAGRVVACRRSRGRPSHGAHGLWLSTSLPHFYIYLSECRTHARPPDTPLTSPPGCGRPAGRHAHAHERRAAKAKTSATTQRATCQRERPRPDPTKSSCSRAHHSSAPATAQTKGLERVTGHGSRAVGPRPATSRARTEMVSDSVGMWDPTPRSQIVPLALRLATMVLACDYMYPEIPRSDTTPWTVGHGTAHWWWQWRFFGSTHNDTRGS